MKFKVNFQTLRWLCLLIQSTSNKWAEQCREKNRHVWLLCM